MKHFLIKYRLKNGSEERWHQDIVRFISALDNDPALRGKISYRCMKGRGGSDYYHIATAADDDAIRALQAREFSYVTPRKRNSPPVEKSKSCRLRPSLRPHDPRDAAGAV